MERAGWTEMRVCKSANEKLDTSTENLLMNVRYSTPEKLLRKVYRRFHPVPGSPWTAGPADDVCAVNLVPPQKLVRFFEGCLLRLKQIKGDEIGDYLEFGVFNGNSIGSMVLASQAAGMRPMKFFGFDAFQGLPAGSEDEDGGVWKTGFYACSFENMQQCLLRRSIDPESITWVRGWYRETLNAEMIGRLNLRKIALVFIDCDTYSSSKSVLDFIAPLAIEPMIICLDDWKLNDLDIRGLGEYKAFNEFLDGNPHLIAKEIESYNRKSKSFLVQPKQ